MKLKCHKYTCNKSTTPHTENLYLNLLPCIQAASSVYKYKTLCSLSSCSPHCILPLCQHDDLKTKINELQAHVCTLASHALPNHGASCHGKKPARSGRPEKLLSSRPSPLYTKSLSLLHLLPSLFSWQWSASVKFFVGFL